ncbi:receptor-type tyrosine-protein phosphatase V-like isoform X1 [Felis catus]|uniref:protein-tyrosine-phosphatase n=1 Tax=Felis catus TaxID=9685 RepID=A0ABI7XQX9_FELCA|nr:receptor-type tyrosine-protein phosphatase V-like isoform X1 [Felis catus]XP_019677528.3 receptor-type tyrosine-protein phosphatase V-like isoform X1 [Felis catus]
MRPSILFAVFLWLRGFLVQGHECHTLARSPDGESGGPPLNVNVSSQGRPTSLFLSWGAPGPDKFSHALRLTHLSPLGSPEGPQLQAHTNASSFEFRDLVPGSRYLLEVTALGPCGQNTTIILTARTAPSPVCNLQLRSPGSPSSLEASWGAAPGGQDGYRLLLYHLESQTLARNISLPPGSLACNFSNLLPGSEYVLEVTTWAGNLQANTSAHQWTAPVSPHQLVLHALGTRALRASWNSSEGAAWFHLMLTNLLGGTSLTAVVRRGASNHTFLHLSPGTRYELTLSAVAGPQQAAGPNVTEWTYPSAPLDLVVIPLPSELWASWKAGSGARDGYLLRLSGQVEKTITLGPGALNATFPGPLPAGPYTLELRVLAGPYDAWARASAWLNDSAAQPRQSNGTTLQLDGLGATREPRRQALLYTEGTPSLLGNISVPPASTQVALRELGPGANYQVDIVSSLGNTTQSPTGHTKLLAPQSLDVTGRGSPSDLTVGWAPAPGWQEGYRVTWHPEGSQRSPDSLIDLGPDNSSLTLRGLVPGSCYTVSVWTWAGNLSSPIQRTRACTLPAPPANLSLGLATQPPALTASWSPPPGGRDGFQLRLYRLRPLTLESKEALTPETQHFSWTPLPPGTAFLVQLATSRGPDESSSTNATGWMPPLAPPLVNVTTEGPTQLRASWVHAPGARDGYQVTLYQAGAQASASTVGAEVDSTSFSALTPGTQYEVEIMSQAGPLGTAAANVSGWTSPLVPNELLVSMQVGSAVINLAWAGGPLGQGVCHAQLSEAGHLSWEQPLALGQALLVLRDLTPGRHLSLSVLCQAGPLQASTHPVVLPVEPGPVEDVQCQPEATRLALHWMMPSGDVDTCLVVAEHLAAGGHAHIIFQANTSGDALLLPGLLPAASYRISLTVLGRNGLWSRVVTLLCVTSAEGWRPPDLAAAPQLEPEAGMGVMITRGMFGQDDGQIQWYGIIATTNMSLVRPPQEAINHTWYDHYYGGQDSYLAILLPNPFYPGPWAVPRSWMVPMGTEDCGQTQEICNGQLKPGSQYRFSVVAFTRYSSPETIISFSAFSEPRASVSRVATSLPAAVGIMMGCVLTICALLGLLYWRRVKGQRAEKSRFSQELTAYNLRRTHRPIPIQSFRQSFEAKSAHAHQAFFQEFEELKEVGKEQPRLEAEHPANATKNRYPHVLPYDHSRVRLTQLEGEPHSDYINANFIPGYSHPQEFIATQGPLKKTLEDFWRLVWEQQVRIIVMLTVGMENGRVLCEHYWPADPTPVTHGHITVHLLAEEPEEEWTKRELQLQHITQQQQRRVKQLQFTTWPDHSVPEAPDSLLSFVELVREQARATQGTGPILVHCSAGVGRTGTFVALSRLLQQLEEEQAVDVFNAVYALRLYRPLMIQTPTQYIFLHNCLLNKILGAPSDTPEAEKTRRGSWGTPSASSPLRPSPRSQPISVMNFAEACAKRAANANAGFLKEYKLLLQAIEDEADSSAPPPGHEQDSTAAYDSSQVRFSPVEESPPNEMLEAWLFPGGPSGHDHVVLTGPAGPEEFWELVWEHRAHVLVSLCPPDTWEKAFWPTEKQPVVTDMVTVHWVAESSTAGWPCTLLRVTHGESRKERQVQRLLFPCWEPGRELPATTLLPFLAAVGRCCSRDTMKPGTLLSHSSKGVAQLGTFLAMDQLLQQVGAECTVDIFNVALQQSQACGLMTPTLEQYIYLYDCLNRVLTDGLP